MNYRKKCRIWMSAIGILFCCANCKAENNIIFEADIITTAGMEMPYRVAHIGNTGKPSVVIYLHGGSSKGNDNEKQMKEAGIDSIANYLEQKHIDKDGTVTSLKKIS